MLRKIKGKPFWYKLWVLIVALAAVFVLLKFFLSLIHIGQFGSLGYVLMVFVHVSLLLDYFLYPSDKNKT
jgi:hypothetical protein